MNRGIVLRDHRTRANKLTIFDELQGKIVAYPRDHDKPLSAPSGSLLAYNHFSWRDVMILETIELKSLPLVKSHQKNEYEGLRFVHQILEILEAFMPFSAPYPELFEKIFLLYTDRADCISGTLFKQHVFLCQMLVFLGVYPDENAYMSNHDVRHLILSPFEFMVDHEDVRMHDALKVWLHGCLATHPTMSTWKTLK